jgi:hypothetical protein
MLCTKLTLLVNLDNGLLLCLCDVAQIDSKLDSIYFIYPILIFNERTRPHLTKKMATITLALSFFVKRVSLYHIFPLRYCLRQYLCTATQNGSPFVLVSATAPHHHTNDSLLCHRVSTLPHSTLLLFWTHLPTTVNSHVTLIIKTNGFWRNLFEL